MREVINKHSYCTQIHMALPEMKLKKPQLFYIKTFNSKAFVGWIDRQISAQIERNMTVC